MQLIDNLRRSTFHRLTSLIVVLGVGWATAHASEDEEDATPFDTPELVVADADPLVLGFVDARSKQNLNGTWNFLVDPMGVGAPGGFFGGWASTRTPVDEWQLLEYSYPTARQIGRAHV